MAGNNERTCKHCRQSFRIPVSRAKGGRGAFCSDACKSATEERNCLTCGTSFHVRIYNKYKARKQYCSTECFYQTKRRAPYANGDGTASIPLSGGLIATIDESDIGLVSGYAWSSVRRKTNTYVVTSIQGVKVPLHRLLLDPPQEMQVDHIDRDGLNNQRSNLRIVTPAENRRNVGPYSPIGLKGVELLPGGKWRARLNHRHLGVFPTATAAALAYDQEARVVFGVHAYLNFPNRKAA